MHDTQKSNPRSYPLRKWKINTTEVTAQKITPQAYKTNLAELGELIYKSIKPNKKSFSIVTGSNTESNDSRKAKL